jgi:hypothetical protein
MLDAPENKWQQENTMENLEHVLDAPGNAMENVLDAPRIRWKTSKMC